MESQKVTGSGAGISRNEFMDHVRQCLTSNFELEESGVEGSLHCDLIARYFNVSGRIFITPQDIIDRVETFERVYIKYFDEIHEDAVQAYFDELCRLAVELSPGKDHFQTDITGVLVCASVSPEIGRQVKKLRFNKTYRFYFRGWCEVRLVCVDLSTGVVHTNPPGRELKKVYSVKKKKQTGNTSK